jgi:hypothetical protein
MSWVRALSMLTLGLKYCVMITLEYSRKVTALWDMSLCSLATFQKNVEPPPSGRDMKAARSSETSVNMYQALLHHILHENIKYQHPVCGGFCNYFKCSGLWTRRSFWSMELLVQVNTSCDIDPRNPVSWTAIISARIMQLLPDRLSVVPKEVQ